VAERAEGFVWRLRADDASEHSSPLRNRAEWFEKSDGRNLVLWWIARGTLPGVEQGMARLKYLQRHGPSAFAFTFDDCFPPPGK
jgi:hypothetical protein